MIDIRTGDCLEVLRTMPAQFVHCCITSPPYFGLRDYGVHGQIGLEQTPAEFVAKLVEVFREVRRVLRDDGTLWLNLGDSYNGTNARSANVRDNGTLSFRGSHPGVNVAGLKPKDLIGIPWRVAFALQDDGWYLRQDIIWHKPNPMPESVRDRCTKAHEYLFLLSKSERYYFDADAIKEPAVYGGTQPSAKRGEFNGKTSAIAGREAFRAVVPTRNRRSVWTVATRPFKGAHFATFPPDLIEPCVLAGCPEGGVVLDPFGGAGTTGVVAKQQGRSAVLIELNPEYACMASERIRNACAQPSLLGRAA